MGQVCAQPMTYPTKSGGGLLDSPLTVKESDQSGWIRVGWWSVRSNCPKHSRFGEISPDLLEISLDSVRSC